MRVLRLLWVAVLFMVGGRFLLLLFGADRENNVVDWIVRNSEFLVRPFFDLFNLANKGIESTGGVFEPASALAFVVYLVAGALILSIIGGAMAGGGWPTARRRPWSWG